MMKIHFDNENVYTSYDNGEWLVQPLNASWLWLIGSLEAGRKIEIKDERKTLQDHREDIRQDVLSVFVRNARLHGIHCAL